MTLRIIVIALSMGVVAFGTFAAVQNAGKPQSFGTQVNYLFLVIAAPMFIAGFVIPLLLPKNLKGQLPSAGNEEEQAVGSAFSGIQVATIVGCALFAYGIETDNTHKRHLMKNKEKHNKYEN